ncbi:MAG: DUF547 domain-containing protein [Pacificimonas sp.]|jgi:hypothetical protein|nr:DUF547 domain-containing protein [Pacificimonas sp.]
MIRSLLLFIAASLTLSQSPIAPTPASAQSLLASAFIPKSDAWTFWDRSGAGYTVDDSALAAILGKYVKTEADGSTRFAYGRVTDADRQRLRVYVNRLEAAPVFAMTRAQQKAYWINLYNAATVELVLEHYPVSSIRKIHGGLFNRGPWGRKILTVMGEEVSLNDIEHRILRPLFPDPRIHYVVNCASVGCPDLRAEPFDPERLDEQMDAAARDYVNHPRGFRVDGDGALTVSSIFSWYGVDFGGPAGVLDHARQFAKPALAKALEGRDGWDDHDYDWNLNDVR